MTFENIQEGEQPSSHNNSGSPHQVNGHQLNGKTGKSPISWLRNLISHKTQADSTLREALEEVIDGYEEDNETLALHERALITNILKLSDMSVTDVMIPRADICAIDISTPQSELFELLAEKQFSRLPVFRDTLDDVVGTIHIKDIMAELAKGKEFQIKDLVRQVPIVSPAMPILDLMLKMQQSTKHMAMVVDEYGGIDGLVTVGDIVESIVGELEDEFQNEVQPELIHHDDGTITADARYDLEVFEEEFFKFLDQEDAEDIDTLGGLVFSIAGRIPARGEVITHQESGIKFEVIDADPRRVNRLRIRNLPGAPLAAE